MVQKFLLHLQRIRSRWFLLFYHEKASLPFNLFTNKQKKCYRKIMVTSSTCKASSLLFLLFFLGSSLRLSTLRFPHFPRSPSAYNSRQNIWNKIEKSSKTGQERKSLTSTFACFLAAIAKVKFLEGRLALGYVSPQIWDFPNISLFPNSYVVRQLVRQLVCQVCYTRYHVSFYLWLIGSVLKHCKALKYYEQDCR